MVKKLQHNSHYDEFDLDGEEFGFDDEVKFGPKLSSK